MNNMTALANRDNAKLRAKHRSFDMRASSSPMFNRQVTIDPCDVEDAWEQLSVNTAVIEFQELPVRLHRSLVKAIRRGFGGTAKP
ncbi:MAG: hypothetical protein GW948_01905 [Rhodobacterales bacterium]|nr:hypothetical protein [Rhodobacterales bacterium]